MQCYPIKMSDSLHFCGNETESAPSGGNGGCTVASRAAALGGFGSQEFDFAVIVGSLRAAQESFWSGRGRLSHPAWATAFRESCRSATTLVSTTEPSSSERLVARGSHDSSVRAPHGLALS